MQVSSKDETLVSQGDKDMTKVAVEEVSDEAAPCSPTESEKHLVQYAGVVWKHEYEVRVDAIHEDDLVGRAL